MKKAIKYFIVLSGIIVMALLVAALTIPFFIDPNDYKSDITILVEEQTGRKLSIDGDIELSVFPWLGMELGRTTLGNAAGFDSIYFAEIDAAEVRIRLVPLLRKEIEVGKIVLRGLSVNLEVNEQGDTNWDDLTGTESAESEPVSRTDADDGMTLQSLKIGGLEILDANVTWADASTNTAYQIENLNLQTGELTPGQPFVLESGLHLSAVQPKLDADITLTARLAMNLEEQAFTVENAELSIDANAPDFVTQPVSAIVSWESVNYKAANQALEVTDMMLNGLGVRVSVNLTGRDVIDNARVSGTLSTPPFAVDQLVTLLSIELPEGVSAESIGLFGLETDFAIDLEAQTLTMQELAAQALDIDITASISGSSIIDAPRFNGSVNVADFSPALLLSKFDNSDTTAENSDVLAKASLNADFNATSNSIALNNTKLILDQSTITGRLAVTDLERQALDFDLQIDNLNADRYLPAEEEAAVEEEEASTALDDIEIPVDLIRPLLIDGNLRIARLQALDLAVEDVLVTVKAVDGKLRVYPIRTKMYQGGYSGDIAIDVSGDLPTVRLVGDLETVQIEPLLKDFMGEERVSGVVNLSMRLRGRGNKVGQIRRSLNGDIAFTLLDGAVEGANLLDAIKNSYAIINEEKSKPGAGSGERTEIAEMTGSGKITDGILQSNDLAAEIANITTNGAGTVNLYTEFMDLKFGAQIGKRRSGQGLDITELEGIQIPFTVRCKLSEFSADCIDIKMGELRDALLGKKKEELEQRLKEEKEAQKARLLAEQEKKKEELKKKEEELKEEAKKKLKDKLKGLFD